MMEDAGAMKGIIFVILTIIIGIGIWVTNRRKRKQREEWAKMLTRRAALQGGSAVAASAALIGLAEAAPSPDAQLIAWEAEIHRRDAAIDQAKLITDKELRSGTTS